MKRIDFIKLLLIFLFIPITNFSQVTTTRGNLLVIDMHGSEINFSDTVGSWEKKVYSQGTTDQFYLNVITNSNNKYLLLSQESYDYDFGLNNSTYNYLQIAGSDFGQQILYYWGWYDVPDPNLHFNPYISKVENGAWILFGTLGNTFIRNDDSLFITTNYYDIDLIHIAGEIGEEYVVTLQELEGGYSVNKFFLVDLSFSSEILNKRELIIEPPQDDYMFSIKKISHIEDDAYAFLSADGRLWVAGFDNSTDNPKLNLVVSHEWYQPEETQLIGKNLFTAGSGYIYVQEINVYDFSLSKKEILIDNVNFNHNNGFNSNFFSFIRNDSLIIYSLKEKSLVNIFDLSAINYRGNVIVDSPYVYVHQTLTVTNVENEIVKNEFVLLQNYPNPFNPTTKIKFTIPNVGKGYIRPQQTKLIVYDILGKEVKTLINEIKTPGIYEVEFDASNLASGVYFYQLRSGNYISTKKMMLMR